jgi:hypothetical protein
MIGSKKPQPLGDLSENDIARFWSKVKIGKPDECWNWTAGTAPGGYGAIWMKGKMIRAHRVSYYCFNGDPPNDKPLICHKCDNPKCCNPAHLFAGSSKDNSEDMSQKGRNQKGECHYSKRHPEKIIRGAKHYSNMHPEKVASGERNGARTRPDRVARGERQGLSKLNTSAIYEIRRLFEGGASKACIAKQFGVTRGCIIKVLRKKTWAHLPDLH